MVGQRGSSPPRACNGASFPKKEAGVMIPSTDINGESHTNPKSSKSVKAAACREEEKQRRKRATDKNKALVKPHISMDVALISSLYCKMKSMKRELSHIHVTVAKTGDLRRSSYHAWTEIKTQFQ